MRRLVVLLVLVSACRWQELIWQPDYVWVCVRWEEATLTINGVSYGVIRGACLEWKATRAVDTIPAPPVPLP